MRKLIFLLFILVVGASHVHADEVTFTASAPDVVAVNDQFRLTYTVNTHNVKDFRGPGSIEGFDNLMGPNRAQSSSTQYINGKMTSSQSITYTYVLRATKEGVFSIPAATIVADGKQVISNAVPIKVLPADQKSQSSSGSSSGGSRQSGGNRSSASSSGNSIAPEDLLIRAIVTKTNVYEQEAFLLTYKIYTLVDLAGFDNVKLPDFKGFHSQEVELAGNQKWELERYNDRNYHATVYRQFVLFPQQAGELVIEPARFDASVAKAVRPIDAFDAFFNGGSNYVEVKKPIHTPRITVNVKPLPAGKPAGFSGGVGDFNITSSISTQQVKTNDAITLKLVISGTGNMRLLANPKIEFPQDFEMFDPKVEDKVRLTRDGLTGNRVIEYLAIPRHAGTFTIPGINFSYFDLKSQSYKTIKTEEYTIEVERGEGNAEQVIANFTNKEELKILGEDIRFIKLNEVNTHPKGYFFFGSLGYWLFYLIPALLFILLFYIYRKQAVENANVAKVRTKKANKMAVRRLKQAGALLAENKKDAFYDEVLKALWGYISDKLNIPVSKLSKDNIEEKLANHGVNSELIKEFIHALNECEFARFAPGDQTQAMDKVYETALDIISKIEGSIKH